MDILIPHNWLKDYLKTKATPKEIATYLSLCGPSVERIHPGKTGPVYAIEVTTNRIDMASILGIAREAQAILPTFGHTALLETPKTKSKQITSKSVSYLKATVDQKLCKRFTALLIRNTQIKISPQVLQERLLDSNLRPINNVVDISNYLMLEFGQPVHTFDYDKIANHKMILRPSKPGEKVTTLDGKTLELPGGDIVIEDGEGKIIDLCGIMGAQNSAINENTKNVLLFVQHYNPAQIRKTSMSTGLRSAASTLFEKDLDPQNVLPTLRRGIDLLTQLTGGKAESIILDIWPLPDKQKEVQIAQDFVNLRLGIKIPTSQIVKILESLGFETSLTKSKITAKVPTYRAGDIDIPEDLVEEIARIYGYHNLPSNIMGGSLPEKVENTPFEIENKIRSVLTKCGGYEIYTSSLVAKNDVSLTEAKSLKLKNPLGKDGEYLRRSITPSLINAVISNKTEKPFFMFELGNIYIPKNGELPEERMSLSIAFHNFEYGHAKGIIETLLDSININYIFVEEKVEGLDFQTSLEIYTNKIRLGVLGFKENTDTIVSEFDIPSLLVHSVESGKYRPIPKYPPQTEDLTFVFPYGLRIGKIIDEIKNISPLISDVDYLTSYENTKTLRIIYQSKEKTLTNSEVETIRKTIISRLEKNFNVKIKN